MKMKIKTILDVVTNSSTELFILKSSKTKKQLDSLFKKSGSTLRVYEFSSDDWKTWLAQGKPAEVEGNELSKVFGKMNGVIIDQDSRNLPWINMYENFLIRPTKTEPDEHGVYEVLPTGFNDLQKKFCEDHLYAWIDEALSVREYPEHLRRILEEFKKDHETFYRLPLHSFVFKHKSEWTSWVLKNINSFPGFPELLKIYGYKSIQELYGKWLSWFEEDSEGVNPIVPESINESDYEFYRLS